MSALSAVASRRSQMGLFRLYAAQVSALSPSLFRAEASFGSVSISSRTSSSLPASIALNSFGIVSSEFVTSCIRMARSGGYFKVFWICISQSQSDAPVMDQPPNVARVVRHPERSSDQLGNQGEGPAVALQAVLGRLLSEQSGQPAEVLRGEFWWSPGDRSPGERVAATRPPASPP